MIKQTAQTNALSLGRFWGSAKSAELIANGDGTANYVLVWADGATVNQFCETVEQAEADLARLGFRRSQQLRMAA